jgi:hypothetical protein
MLDEQGHTQQMESLRYRASPRIYIASIHTRQGWAGPTMTNIHISVSRGEQKAGPIDQVAFHADR